jgi:hypothetical protein
VQALAQGGREGAVGTVGGETSASHHAHAPTRRPTSIMAAAAAADKPKNPFTRPPTHSPLRVLLRLAGSPPRAKEHIVHLGQHDRHLLLQRAKRRRVPPRRLEEAEGALVFAWVYMCVHVWWVCMLRQRARRRVGHGVVVVGVIIVWWDGKIARHVGPTLLSPIPIPFSPLSQDHPPTHL